MAFKALANRTFGVGFKRYTSIQLDGRKFSAREKLFFEIVFKIMVFFSSPISTLKNRKELDKFIKDYLK